MKLGFNFHLGVCIESEDVCDTCANAVEMAAVFNVLTATSTQFVEQTTLTLGEPRINPVACSCFICILSSLGSSPVDTSMPHSAPLHFRLQCSLLPSQQEVTVNIRQECCTYVSTAA